MSNTCNLQSLQDGDRFEIPSLKDTMRNLTVVRVGTGSVVIKGEKREAPTSEDWKGFEYAVSCSTPVVFLGKSGDVVADTVTPAVADTVKGDEPAVVKAVKVAKDAEPAVKNRRGRPSKNVALTFPSGDFTVGDVATLNGVEKYDVTNYLKKLAAEGNALNLVEVGSRKTGSKGKPSKVFRLA